MDYLPLEGRRRGFTPRALVSSSITHCCVALVFASLFPYLCLLFSAVDVILNWFIFFINSIYSLCSFSTHFVFVIKLELVFLISGSKRSQCILHYLNFHLVSERVHSLWYTEIFTAQLATPSRVDLPVAKNTWKFFSQFCLWVFWWLALATFFSHEKRVFCISKTIFKTFLVFPLKFLWLFTVFPNSFSTETDPNTPQTPFLHHFFSNLQEKV